MLWSPSRVAAMQNPRMRPFDVLLCFLTAAASLQMSAVAPRTAAECSLHRIARVTCMAKGDGKKSRPPKPPTPPPAAPAAPDRVGRVSSDSLLSVRKQIAIAKSFKKQATRGAAKPPVRTSFRRKSKEEAGRNASKAAVDEDVEVDMRSPHLFVDGYNVIGAWPRLKKPFEKGDLLQARELLLADVADYAISQFEVVVVFDANGAADRIEGKDRFDTYGGGLVTVVFAHDSADAYIERETKVLRAEGRQVQVATSDNGIATATATHGATVMSSRRFVAELKAARKSAAIVVDEFNRRQDRLAGVSRPLWDALPSDLQQQWDASIQADVVNNRLSKAQLAAKAAHEELLRSGALDRGAAARRRQLEQERAQARRGRRPQASRSLDDAAKPMSPFDSL